MLTIILTSYNRPVLLRRSIESIKAQTFSDWKVILFDDNSNDETLEVIKECTAGDKRFDVRYMETTDEERKQASRYAVLINSVLPKLRRGMVGYLCDNVEYESDCFEQVMKHFEKNPSHFAVYVLQGRDMWTPDGREYLCAASIAGHWDRIPLGDPRVLGGNLKGQVDHSQVFHRLPVKLQWSERVETVGYGDAVFYRALATEYGGIHPVNPGHVLTREHLLK